MVLLQYFSLKLKWQTLIIHSGINMDLIVVPGLETLLQLSIRSILPYSIFHIRESWSSKRTIVNVGIHGYLEGPLNRNCTGFVYCTESWLYKFLHNPSKFLVHLWILTKSVDNLTELYFHNKDCEMKFSYFQCNAIRPSTNILLGPDRKRVRDLCR